MELLLGLDVGTTATKALLFDDRGHVIASGSHPSRLITPRPGWVEQDPEALWQSVLAAVGEAVRQIEPGDRVLALALSAQGGTTIPVDDAGRPTHNAFSWMDGRALEECARVKSQFGEEAIYRKTGWALWEGLPLQHIAWFRTHCAEQYARTRHYLFVNDFIGLRLTGALCMDPCNAGITQLLNVATRDWDERLLELAGIERRQLSPLCPSGAVVGTLSDEATAATGLAAGTPLVNGAHDQYCAAVGLGITRPGRTMLSCGTAWVLLAVPETLEIGFSSGMRLSPHAVADRWGAVLSLGGVGASLEWLVDQVGGASSAARAERYAAINAGAALSPAGAGGLVFIPLSGGHPERLTATSGGFLGLSLSHTRDDMARAVMEGIAYELRWTLDGIQAAGVAVDRVIMAGGAARSPVWPGIVAGVTGLPVALPAVTEAASWGAAILAGVGVGLFADVRTAAEGAERAHPWRDLEPEPVQHAQYDALYARYRRLAEAVPLD